ncbi:MAG: DNA polymerase/3'-5' exonuclease PolX [Syntrophus sp. (in: bacteria)]|nr:DNA polymerase/3'-5' exonuclease PolX [Syntrophus sp. (in: bacteria)]
MEKRPIPELLEEIGVLLEIKGENPFKTNAYYRAAKTLSAVDNLEEMIRERRLKEIKGIGDTLSQKIEEYHETGKMAYYEELTTEIPLSLLELMGVPSLGPKKIKMLHDTLGITNLGELEYACRENRLITLPGFGGKTQEKILKGIEFMKRHKGQYLFGDVYPLAETLKEYLINAVSPPLIEVCGSIRRKKEIVRDIDILVAGADHEGITNAFIRAPEVEEVMLRGETKTSCRLNSGIEADLRVVDKDAFPYALTYFTGSKEHNVLLRGIAKRKGWKLNEYGLFEDDRLLPCRDETELYAMLGLSFIPPELREDMGEVEAAERGMIPDLVTLEDIKGTFHVHTDFSDGLEGLEHMVDAARRMGFAYIGISDHSKSAFYARGLKAEDVIRQWGLIDTLNEKHQDIHIFKGIESDILLDGSLDYDNDILEGFDFVIASIHSSFTMKKDEMEKRIVRAIENPYITMLGHPTGRLLLSREGYDVDMWHIIDSAAAQHVIIELNASRYRLDIDWRYMKYAKEKGVMISINPDAHSAAGLMEIPYGVGIARKGWQERKDILNTQDVNDIKDTFAGIRDGKRYKGNHT